MPRRKSRESSLAPAPPPGFPKKPKYLPQPRLADPRNADLGRAFVYCGKLLDKLLAHEDGWVFAEPVDARALGILDYYTVISDPMDLGTVRRRLERRRYDDPLAFAADVRLTFRNAMIYNNRGDPVYKSAAELSAMFESGWASVLAEPPPPPADAERKGRLTAELPRLPVDVQGTVIEIMKKIGGFLREENGRVEVDLDKADAATLDELDRLVEEHGAALASVVAVKLVILVAVWVSLLVPDSTL